MKKQNIIPTEQINKNTAGLDSYPLKKAISTMVAEQVYAAKCVNTASAQIERAVKETAKAYQNNNRIVFIGAGTSGRLGILESVECPPTFSVSFDAFTGIIAGGHKAIFKAVEGAEDDADLGGRDFLKQAKKGDILIGIAASGNTPYVQGALKAAKSKKHKTILIACNKNADKKNVDIFIYLPTGPEVISGSTRLKAGTATKIALNTITSLAMVRCGKVYKNYMVDVKASNNKLRQRAIRLISIIAKIPQDTAQQYALKTNYNVKTAVVMAKLAKTKAQAEALLKKHKGYLGKVIDG